jgi:membrane-associated phospholipid phosphatase
LAISGVAGEILKIGFGRIRPYTGQGPRTFNPFTLQDSSSSFPSGHTMTAFVVSSVLAERIDNPFISCGFYAMALLTGAQRIYSNNHWLSDAFFSAIFGTVIGRSVAHREEDVIHGGRKLTWEIDPDISLSSIGLTLKTDF